MLFLSLLLIDAQGSDVMVGSNPIGRSLGVDISLPEPPAFDNNTAYVNSSEIWVTNLGNLDNANSTHFQNDDGELTLNEEGIDAIGKEFFAYRNGSNVNEDFNISDNDFITSGDALVRDVEVSRNINLDDNLTLSDKSKIKDNADEINMYFENGVLIVEG